MNHLVVDCVGALLLLLDWDAEGRLVGCDEKGVEIKRVGIIED